MAIMVEVTIVAAMALVVTLVLAIKDMEVMVMVGDIFLGAMALVDMLDWVIRAMVVDMDMGMVVDMDMGMVGDMVQVGAMQSTDNFAHM